MHFNYNVSDSIKLMLFYPYYQMRYGNLFHIPLALFNVYGMFLSMYIPIEDGNIAAWSALILYWIISVTNTVTTYNVLLRRF